MSVDILDPDVWSTQASDTIRQAAAEYRVWAAQEDRNGFHRLADDLRRLAAKLDRLYGPVTVEAMP